MTQEKRILLETKMNEVLKDIITEYNLTDISYENVGYGSYFFGQNTNSEWYLRVAYDSCIIRINSKFYGIDDQIRCDFRDLADKEDSLFILDVHLKHYFWKFLEENYPKGRTVLCDGG